MSGRSPRLISVVRSKLPQGYTELSYIQGDGASYINTRFNPNQNTVVRADIAHDLSSRTCWIFGARNGTNVDAFGFLTYKGAYRADYGTATTNLSGTPTGRFTIEMNKNSVKIDGAVIATAAVQTFVTNCPIYLFANNNAGASAGFSITKIYGCEIYNDDILMREFIPCRRNSDNALGMYDTVYGTFYQNAGSGAFIGG